MAAMLILLALGAPETVIREDFARTNTCRAAEIQAYCDQHAEEIARQPEREAYYRAWRGSTRKQPSSCWTPCGRSTAPRRRTWKRNMG